MLLALQAQRHVAAEALGHILQREEVDDAPKLPRSLDQVGLEGATEGSWRDDK